MFPTTNTPTSFSRQRYWDRTNASCALSSAKRFAENYKKEVADTKRRHERNKNAINSLHRNSTIHGKVKQTCPPPPPYKSTHPSMQKPSRHVDGHAAGPQRAPPSGQPLQLGRPTCRCRSCGIRYRCVCTLKPSQRTRRLQPLEAMSAPWLRWGRVASLESGWDVRSGKLEARNVWAIS